MQVGKVSQESGHDRGIVFEFGVEFSTEYRHVEELQRLYILDTIIRCLLRPGSRGPRLGISTPENAFSCPGWATGKKEVFSSSRPKRHELEAMCNSGWRVPSSCAGEGCHCPLHGFLDARPLCQCDIRDEEGPPARLSQVGVNRLHAVRCRISTSAFDLFSGHTFPTWRCSVSCRPTTNQSCSPG